MRPLKHHEQKLLKKVDFLKWKKDNALKENEVMRKYHIPNREEYLKYNRLVGDVRKIAAKLVKLDEADPFRIRMTEQLLEKLYRLGVIPLKQSLAQLATLSTSAFCRRRLPVVLVRLKMAETVQQAVRYIEQGHIRVGPDTVVDPAFLVTRNYEDFVTWTDTSKIKRKVLQYNDKLDDYDLLA
eukprot:GCRY01003398.1.p1 GENE.GCRY01003398.1~~GCRY01003398.1.p1  ORF type:complete len:211 (+),score=40.48 GCRY01003398.1:86-634(+)